MDTDMDRALVSLFPGLPRKVYRRKKPSPCCLSLPVSSSWPPCYRILPIRPKHKRKHKANRSTVPLDERSRRITERLLAEITVLRQNPVLRIVSEAAYWAVLKFSNLVMEVIRNKSMIWSRMVAGLKVEFPPGIKPYPSQISVVEKIIRNVRNKETILIESVTGSGKGIAILAAVRSLLVNDSELKVIISSRTHLQLSQLVNELKQFPELEVGAISVLGGREQLCTNPIVQQKTDRDKECEKLFFSLDGSSKHIPKCTFFRRSASLDHVTLRSLGFPTVFDIEDLNQAASEHKFCAFYAAKRLVPNVRIIFAPYQYILDPRIRRSLDLHLEKFVVIFDEAHNVETASRQAFSGEFTSKELNKLRNELLDLQKECAIGFPVGAFVQLGVDRLAWSISEKAVASGSSRIEISGQDLHTFLANAFISDNTFPFFDDAATLLHGNFKVFKDNQDYSERCLTRSSVTTLRNVVFLLENFLKGPEKYGLLIESSNAKRCLVGKRKARDYALVGAVESKLIMTCLHGETAVTSMGKTSGLVLLSGTLQPFQYFQAELGLHSCRTFAASTPKRDCLCLVVHTGPNSRTLCGSYNNNSSISYQDELGDAMCKLCETLPNGALCFFPSHMILENCIARWKTIGTWQEMLTRKLLLVDSTNGEQATDAVSDYGPASGSRRGCVLFSVHRSRVSEGANMCGGSTSAVILIGIPYPAMFDQTVIQKRRFNSAYLQHSPSTDWYHLQAVIAYNQSIGRCIRKQTDRGVIVMIDSRLRWNHPVRKGLPVWMQHNLREGCFQQAVEGIVGYFKSHK